MYSLLTRSQRISHENLRLRDKAWLEGYERWFARRAGVPVGAERTRRRRRCSRRSRVRGLDAGEPHRRLADGDVFGADGVPTISTWCISARARMGGAGLVFAEMTCVSPDARITPGCLGLWNDEQATAWKRVVDFVHANSDAKVGIQLGHAGRKGCDQCGLGRHRRAAGRRAAGR